MIIASSSKGYKIPTNHQNLIDFVEYTDSIVMLMLYRLKKFTDKIYMGTLQEVDLLDNLKYKKIKEILKQIGEN